MTSTRQTAHDLIDKWTLLWNGDLGVAEDILTPDFRIEFGAVIDDPDPAAITSPAGMADFVAGWRAKWGDLHFAPQGVPVVDDGAIAFTWSVELPGAGIRSGIDLCHLRDSRISRVWSVTGERLFP